MNEERDLLLMAVVNQLEDDFDNQDYESLDCLLTELLKNEENREEFVHYLSDDMKERWIEGKVTIKY
jgi:hypothetical protein